MSRWLVSSLCLSALSLSCYAEDELFEDFNLLFEQPQESASKITAYSDDSSVADTSDSTPVSKTPSSIHSYYAYPDNDHRFFIAVDYLYWTVSEQGMYFATTKSTPIVGEQPVVLPNGAPSNPTTGQIGKIKKQQFGWSSGVRGMLGYQFKNTGWNLSADYTYYNNTHDQNVYRPQTPYGYLSGMGDILATQVLAGSNHSKVAFNYQNAKLLLGTPWKSFAPGRVQLLFGAHSTWVDQTWDVNFYPLPSGTYPSSVTFNKWKNSSWGVGCNLMGRFDANLGKGFSFGIQAFAAALLGQQSLRDYATIASNTTGIKSVNFDVRQSPTYQFMSQFMLSPQIAWSRSFTRESVRIELAYEFNALLNMLDMYRHNGISADLQSAKFPTYQSNSIYLNGLTVKFGLGF